MIKLKQQYLILKCQEASKIKTIRDNPIFQSIFKLSQVKMTENEIKQCLKEVKELIKKYKEY